MMSEEEAFLAALRAEPEEDSHRLVYADWLEERGDPRAEYLRLEHAVRIHRAPGEERLRVLRSQLDADWLRAVHDGNLGPDWAIVLQAYKLAQRPALVRQICAATGLSEVEAEEICGMCPQKIKGGLRYWHAHRLRRTFDDLAFVTVELRPSRGAGPG
jgi:uncharacterized protein (TIGR02996 family)